MDVAVIGVFIPIIFILVAGLVWASHLYFRSREKQMMIEKGLSYEQMMEFFKSKKNPYTLLKVGVITIFFGLGLGLGMILQEATGSEVWIPFLLFTGTGLGFVVAFQLAKKHDLNEVK